MRADFPDGAVDQLVPLRLGHGLGQGESMAIVTAPSKQQGRGELARGVAVVIKQSD